MRNWQVGEFKDSEDNTTVIGKYSMPHKTYKSPDHSTTTKRHSRRENIQCHKLKRWEMYLKSLMVSM